MFMCKRNLLRLVFVNSVKSDCSRFEARLRVSGGREWQYCLEEREQLKQYKLELQQSLEYQARRDGHAEGASEERLRQSQNVVERCEEQRDAAVGRLRAHEEAQHDHRRLIERDYHVIKGEMTSAVQTLDMRYSECELAQRFLEERHEIAAAHLCRERECVVSEQRLALAMRLEHDELRGVAHELREEYQRAQLLLETENAERQCPMGTRKRSGEDNLSSCSTVPNSEADVFTRTKMIVEPVFFPPPTLVYASAADDMPLRPDGLGEISGVLRQPWGDGHQPVIADRAPEHRPATRTCRIYCSGVGAC